MVGTYNRLNFPCCPVRLRERDEWRKFDDSKWTISSRCSFDCVQSCFQQFTHQLAVLLQDAIHDLRIVHLWLHKLRSVPLLLGQTLQRPLLHTMDHRKMGFENDSHSCNYSTHQHGSQRTRTNWRVIHRSRRELYWGRVYDPQVFLNRLCAITRYFHCCSPSHLLDLLYPHLLLWQRPWNEWWRTVLGSHYFIRLHSVRTWNPWWWFWKLSPRIGRNSLE